MATYVTIVNTQAKDDIALLSELEALREGGSVGPEQLVERAAIEAGEVERG